MNLQDVQLTEEDFILLSEALDALPEKGKASLMMGDLIGNMLAGDNPRIKKDIEDKIKRETDKFEAKNKERADDITLLKSKLILLKRFLQTNGALATAEKIINKK